MDILQNYQYRQQVQGIVGLSALGDRLLLLFVFTLPFLSAFAITPIFSIPFLLSVMLFALMLYSIWVQKKLPEGFLGFDIIFVSCILLLVLFSYLVNGRGHSKSLNHTVAYISTFLLFYITIKFLFFNSLRAEWLFRKVLVVLTATVLVSAVYAIIEFVLNNYFNININDYIYRPPEGVKDFDATVLALFTRSRGFAVESGHFTFMMEQFSPLVIYYLYFSGHCHWKKIFKALSLVLIIASFITAFSTASFIIVPVSITVVSLLYLRPVILFIKNNLFKVVISVLLVAIALVVLNQFYPIFDWVWLSIVAKLEFGGYSYRENNLNFFFTTFSQSDITNKLIGIGPAGSRLLGFGTSHAILNLYFSFTFEIGLLALLFFMLLVIYCLFHIPKLKKSFGYFATISVLAGMMHYYFIGNYYYPWFWFVLVFILFAARKVRYLK